MRLISLLAVPLAVLFCSVPSWLGLPCPDSFVCVLPFLGVLFRALTLPAPPLSPALCYFLRWPPQTFVIRGLDFRPPLFFCAALRPRYPRFSVLSGPGCPRPRRSAFSASPPHSASPLALFSAALGHNAPGNRDRHPGARDARGRGTQGHGVHPLLQQPPDRAGVTSTSRAGGPLTAVSAEAKGRHNEPVSPPVSTCPAQLPSKSGGAKPLEGEGTSESGSPRSAPRLGEARRTNAGPGGMPERQAAGHKDGTGPDASKQRPPAAANPDSAQNTHTTTAWDAGPSNT